MAVSVHEKFIKQAIALALRGYGKTSPNPVVGAVVVKNGVVIGKGFHEKAGGPHAEIAALESAGAKANGATLYVTLEPCTHFGRTPPCVDAIIKSGVKKVVVGMIDPNPINNGKGIEILRQHKIDVEVGFCQDKLHDINEVFIKYITKRMPFVVIKVGQSLDGKIATRTGESRWITGEKAREFSHQLRGDFDAVMVGVNTVLRDNPKLNAWNSLRQPAKVIIDSNLSTPENSSLFTSSNAKVILVTLPTGPGQETPNREKLSRKAIILEVKAKDGQVDLRDTLKKLARLEITSILVEGGGALIGSFVDEKLVDKAYFFINPCIIGGKEAISSVMGKGVDKLSKAARLSHLKLRALGEDYLVEGKFNL